ncbi:MAG TPA: ABC transporter ATP-binding protein [Rhodospirillales bacterium]|nr:ABC transporter ATP-binding protein [Rhodospirillales bacterium]
MTMPSVNGRLIKALKLLLRISTTNFGIHERQGLRLVGKYLLSKSWLLVLLVLTGLFAAVFEGGTVGLLGLAVSVLVGDKGSADVAVLGYIEKYVGGSFQSFDRGDIFVGLIGIAIASQILKNVLLYGSTACQIVLSYGLRRDLQKTLIKRIMTMSFARVSKYPLGKLVTVVDQGDLVAQILGQIGLVVRAIMMAVAYAVVMIMMSPVIAAGTVAVIGILWLALNKLVKIIRFLADEAFHRRIDVWRWTIEYISAPRLIRLFNATDYAEKIITDTRDLELLPERKTDLIQTLVPNTLEIFTVTGAGIFLIAGYILAGNTAMSVIPTFFVFVLVFFRIRPLIKVFNDFRMKLAHIIPRLGAVGEVVSGTNEKRNDNNKIQFLGLKNSVQFKGVNFSYPDSKNQVLENVNFEIRVGQTIALIGGSGGGKSTIADLFLGLYEPTNGNVIIDGVDLKGIKLDSWRQCIGVVDQDVFLLNTSVLENIRFARPEIPEKSVIDAAKMANAHQFIQEFDQGYDTIVGDRGFKLSGGQQQRIGLARALVHNPEILVLDEATSALDSISEHMIQQALENMHNQKTILMIAHRLSTVRNADYILVLDKGKLVEQGTRDDLLEADGYFAKLWGLQVAGIHRS